MVKPVNAGKYNRRITIFRVTKTKDAQGFKTPTRTELLQAWAAVKTTRGFTLIKNNTDFEKAYTNFTIRMPATKVVKRYDQIDFHGKTYSIEYLNDVDAAGVELEIQASEVTK